jgi:hypothetical protein
MRFLPLVRGMLSGLILSCCALTATLGSAADWFRVTAGPFSISAPPGWHLNQLQGVDSYVGEFVGDGLTLKFDFGAYSNDLKDTKKPAYIVVHKSIDGFRAKVVSPRTPGHGITAIYFSNVDHKNRLCLWGNDLSATQQELALRIFETIQFGGRGPTYVMPPAPPL